MEFAPGEESPSIPPPSMRQRAASCPSGSVVSRKARAKPRSENYEPEFRLDTNLAHGVFLDQPTRETGHVFGVMTNGAFRFNRYLDMAIKVGISTLFPDPTRSPGLGHPGSGSIAPGISFRSGPWMWFFRTGLELLYMDPYEVQTNPDCKFFGVDSERCPAGSSLEEDHSLLLGLPLYVGGSMNLTDSVYLSITSSFHIFSRFPAGKCSVQFPSAERARHRVSLPLGPVFPRMPPFCPLPCRDLFARFRTEDGGEMIQEKNHAENRDHAESGDCCGPCTCLLPRERKARCQHMGIGPSRRGDHSDRLGGPRLSRDITVFQRPSVHPSMRRSFTVFPPKNAFCRMEMYSAWTSAVR